MPMALILQGFNCKKKKLKIKGLVKSQEGFKFCSTQLWLSDFYEKKITAPLLNTLSPSHKIWGDTGTYAGVWVSYQRCSPGIPHLLSCMGLEMLRLWIQPVNSAVGQQFSILSSFFYFLSHGLRDETPCYGFHCSLCRAGYCCCFLQLLCFSREHWFSSRVAGCQLPAAAYKLD